MPSLPSSALLSWSQLFSSLLMSPELFSSLLISAYLSFSQIFTARLNSSQLPAAPVSSSCAFSSLLSLLLSHLLSSSHKNGSRRQSKQPLQRRFHTENFYTQQAFAQRSLDTQKLLHTVGKTFLHSEAITHSKLSGRESFTHRSFYTQPAFTQHTFTHRSFYTQQDFTQRSFCTELGKLLFTESFYTQKLLHTASFYTEELFHREATLRSFLHGRFHTQQVFNLRICWQIHYRNLDAATPVWFTMPAARDNSIPHAAAAPGNLDAAITMRSAQTELQSTKELRATASEIAAPKPDLDVQATKLAGGLEHFFYFPIYWE